MYDDLGIVGRLGPVLALILAACSDEMALETADRRPIRGGSDEYGWAPVGTLSDDSGICTATLVGPRVVLTAKHCISEEFEPSDLSFRIGRFEEQTVGHGVATFYLGQHQEGVDADDIGVIVLDQEAPVAPALYRRTGMEGEEGEHVELVGFGETGRETGDADRKRSGQARIVSVSEAIFRTTPGDGGAFGCKGDSGGPAFLDGAVAGVLSFGDFQGNYNGYTRVDAYLDLIEQAERWAEERYGAGGGAGADPGGGWGSGGGGGGDGADDDVCYCDELCAANGDCCAGCGGDDGGSGAGCYCDADCGSYGDCCVACPGGGDGEGGSGADVCYCDAECDDYGDCCADCGSDDGWEIDDGDDDCYCDVECDDYGDCCADCGSDEG